MKQKILAMLGAALLTASVALAAPPADVQMVQVPRFEEGNSYLEMTYPDVTVMGNRAATAQIRQYYANEQRETQEFFNKQKEKAGSNSFVTETKSYEVTHNDGNYLSIVESGEIYFGRDAHPTHWKKGTTFDVTTGKVVTWQEILKPGDEKYFTIKKINQALFTSKYQLSSYFTGLTQLPQNYYLDKAGNIHFLFGLYEVAPYSAGIVDLNMMKRAK